MFIPGTPRPFGTLVHSSTYSGQFWHPFPGNWGGKGRRPGYTYRGFRMNAAKHKGRKRG